QHPTPNTQHPTPNTQHPTPNTQHPTPNTQHPTPNTQHMKHPRDILSAHDIEAKKSLGQNFLFDEHLLRRIAEAIEVRSSDSILEVGPGLGSLTAKLAERAGRVVAVELDDRLIPILRLELARYPHVELIHGDILDFRPEAHFKPDESYKIIANVPYYITGAILEHLLSAPKRPSAVALTVQKDVAERIAAEPGDMSVLAVSVQFFGRPRVAFNLAAGAFWPKPKVASSVITIDCTRRPERAEQVTDEKRFFRIVKTGFSQKRKQLHNNLRQILSEKEAVLAWLDRAGIDSRRRPQTLSLTEWIRLYETYP
ncbi:MAG: 16S rRNA (adenine(1518)-N(6)/adenine(1519)-N(6))-dimethyltransferase RsmA, partial [Ardenticatenaceae bacterium]|nr:16S rRNA (adenine(1518)-N(6)/adenine(1519)-N(6))-dimethyltransferase RsmA [Ardenticatenaceae bacterium]